MLLSSGRVTGTGALPGSGGRARPNELSGMSSLIRDEIRLSVLTWLVGFLMFIALLG